jgi:hypothetical protein
MTSARIDCWRDAQLKGSATKPRGVCYDVATKDYAACATDERFAPCFVTTVEDVTYFARGACRDGGSWVNAYKP